MKKGGLFSNPAVNTAIMLLVFLAVIIPLTLIPMDLFSLAAEGLNDTNSSEIDEIEDNIDEIDEAVIEEDDIEKDIQDIEEAVDEDLEGEEEEEEETVIEDFGDLPVLSVTEGELVKIGVKGQDADGDEIIYTYSQPLGDTGEWQTQEGDAGTYKIKVTASDGELESEKEIIIIVNPAE